MLDRLLGQAPGKRLCFKSQMAGTTGQRLAHPLFPSAWHSRPFQPGLCWPPQPYLSMSFPSIRLAVSQTCHHLSLPQPLLLETLCRESPFPLSFLLCFPSSG